MSDIVNRVLSLSDNCLVIERLKITADKIMPKWRLPNSLMNESLVVFLNEYGRFVPEETKYCFNQEGILLNPKNGLIFAIQMGWNGIAFRINLDDFKLGKRDLKELRQFRNMDGLIEDISELNENWVLGIHFVGEVEEMLKRSFEYSNRG